MLCALNAEVVTKTSVKTSTGSGNGVTREAAVDAAIVEALGKMNGVKISSKKFVHNITADTSEGSGYAFTYNEQISKAANGRVDGYEINDIYKDADGNWEATVTIKKTSVSKNIKLPALIRIIAAG